MCLASQPLSQISLKSLLNPTLPFPILPWFPKWPASFPLPSPSSKLPLAPTLPAGISGAPGTAHNHQAGPGIPGPAKTYWPSPAQSNMPRAWLCHRPGKINTAARWVHPPPPPGQRRT